MRTHEKWTVLPHDRLTQIAENILTATGKFRVPVGEAPRRMTVVRLGDGRLVIMSAIALDEDEMKQLESFGTPAFLVVPSGTHRIDVKPWKDRYPALLVVAPPGAREKVEKVVHVDATDADFGDPSVRLRTVAGTRDREFALTVRSAEGTSLVVNDIIFGKAEPARGIGGLFARLMGVNGPEPRIPKVIALALIDSKRAVREQLEAWASLSGLRRIIVAHGEPIESQPAATLRELATSLA